MAEIIKFVDVIKNYNNKIVLNNINISIDKGDTIALIGPSGSGKSTFLRCINRLEKTDSGSIIIHEVIFDKYNITKEISMVFQHFNLFANMNIYQNLSYAPSKILKMSDDNIRVRALKLLDIVGMKDKIDDSILELSGGQKQRVAIARSLMMDPKIILFDEPTSALDPFMAGEIMNIIKNIINPTITTLIVSHNVELVSSIANKIFEFNNSKINIIYK